MAFWLAKRRTGQASSYIQRFDPRFWTVNFPRPAMASVITTGPDSMRVDCEFLHKGELVGLIWESEDTLDHPLLAYSTKRDYRHCVLRFRWQSTGLIELDAPNGPTLTIEGRDENGTAQTWYVRLWNFATGSSTNAQVHLPFSELASGYFLPGDPIFAGDIDRMFISLAPPGFEAASEEAFSSHANGFAEISEISCDGANAVLETGDVVCPVHGERIATAYDDSYNQTPARLLRTMVGLGYRTEAVHYVGMSHFMRLDALTGGALEVSSPAALCEPAAQWHRNFFAEAKDNEFEVIASISYELFDEYCPSAWKQMAFDGEVALTGWVPPSTLLSPANVEAMDWLKQATGHFVDLLEQTAQPVRVQIGEPWWWTTPAGKPCIYDPAAQSAFGGSPVSIIDLRAPLNQAQTDLLDDAGALLAQSTADLTSHIRAAASGPAEVLLLAFTPTILDGSMPEAHRANLPDGWAYPAFDRLQLEDYDWLTAGADALRRNAYTFVDAKLGYPIDQQDYFSGFVLLSEDAEQYWRLIDRGLDEARARGVARRFVWALPQINRDGFVRLPLPQEEEVQAFDDVLYPFALGKTAGVGPEFSTSVAVTSSGHEHRNSLWSDARMHFDVGPGIRSEDELSQILAFFRARRGAARGFRVRDPFDFSSNAMTGTPGPSDQLLGIGNGNQSDFALIKTYGDTTEPQTRRITRPLVESLIVSVAGTQISGWTLAEKGIVSLDIAPPVGAEIRAGFLFDVPVRFAEDRLDISSINFEAGEAPSIQLIEVRESE